MYTTRTSLLQKLSENDSIAWNEFYTSYKDLFYSVILKNHLPECDADDIVQQVMLALFNNGNFIYDRNKHGTFRSYLGGILRHKTVDYLRRNKVTEVLPENLIDEHACNELFLNEYRRHILKLAIDEMRSQVSAEAFEAFQLCVLRNYSDKDAAKLLDAKANTITVRKRRCIELLTKIIARLNSEDPELQLVFQ